MKVVILAGGLGTRISEESQTRPKPMIEIGGKPILWHLMKFYAAQGLHEFIICCGYKGYVIKEYFANYFLHMSDVTFHMDKNEMEVHEKFAEPWKITLIDTGETTQTGGRINRIKSYVNDTFCLTYGDGLSNIDIRKLIDFHFKQKKLVTVSAVQPPARFGSIELISDTVNSFKEKNNGDANWINGGFFVCEMGIFDRLGGDELVWEREPMESLVKDGQLSAWRHEGYWAAMDTLRDKVQLEELWNSNKAPWKIW